MTILSTASKCKTVYTTAPRKEESRKQIDFAGLMKMHHQVSGNRAMEF